MGISTQTCLWVRKMALFGLHHRSNKQTNKQTNHFEKTEKQRKLPQFTYQSSTDYIFA